MNKEEMKIRRYTPHTKEDCRRAAECIIELKQRIDRAIEYIKKHKQIYDADGTEENMLDEFNTLASPKMLLEILGGKE